MRFQTHFADCERVVCILIINIDLLIANQSTFFIIIFKNMPIFLKQYKYERPCMFCDKKKTIIEKKLQSKTFLIAMLQFQHQNILKNTALAITAVAL